jgi:hypothetical protein
MLMPDSSVPRPSILEREFTLKTEGFEDMSSTMVVSLLLGATVTLS